MKVKQVLGVPEDSNRNKTSLEGRPNSLINGASVDSIVSGTLIFIHTFIFICHGL